MAKLVDALASGASGRKAVQVRFLFWALKIKKGRTQPRSPLFYFSATKIQRGMMGAAHHPSLN
jgi:hypothetical protein